MKRILSHFSKENTVRGASVILIVTLTLSNVLGLVRDRLLTRNISTYNLDIYYAAFRIPDLIFNFLILGAISSAFIPIFSDYLAKGKKDEAWKTANNLINIGIVLMLGSALVLYFAMPWLVPLIVPKFDAGRIAESVRYARILMLTPVFFSVSYVVGAILNCFKLFVAYSLAPLVYNFSIIVGAALAPRYGLSGVIYCVVAGSVLHLLVQLVAVLRIGYRYEVYLSWRDKSIKRIGRLMIPRTISMGSSQILLIVFTAIASALAAGSISALSLATNIQTVPVVVLGTSFATAIFPILASAISRDDNKEFSFYLNRALRVMGYLLIPSTAVFILLRAQIVRLILGSGKFSWDDTRTTALTLGFLSLSILAQGLIPLISKAFYALKNTRTPMYISLATMFVTIAMAYPMSRAVSVAGLAYAYSIGGYFNLFVLIYYLKKTYPGILDHSLYISYFKTLIATLFMSVGLWFMMHLLANHVDMSRFVGILVQSSVSLLFGLIIFFIMNYILGQEEIKWAFKRSINGEEKAK